MAEAWTWIAHYRDGNSVNEAAVKTFTAVDLANCVAVELLPRRWGGKVVRIVVEPDKGQRAVFLRRRGIIVNLSGRPVKRQASVTVAGWETEAAGVYVYALEDGQIIVSTDSRAM